METAQRTTVSITAQELREVCRAALRAVGADAATCESVTAATIAAERRGRGEVGATHLLDYLEALRGGGMNGAPNPVISTSRPAVTQVDADGGAVQRAFDEVAPAFVERGRGFGIAALSVYNAFSAGALSYYTQHIAEHGLLALAASNARPLMSVLGSAGPILGTNPMSFAIPHPLGPRLFDQASSVTAWVNVRDAASGDGKIPGGWAIDVHGDPTTDATAALAGALLPFGGVKGANLAFMVELLATLSAAAAPITEEASPDRETVSPRLGLFVIAIDPLAFDETYIDRSEERLVDLAQRHGADFGRRKPDREMFDIPVAVLDALTEAAGHGSDTSGDCAS